MTPRKPGTGKGFTRTAKILSGQIRKAGEGRGFAVTRLLTHWPEIAGEDIAGIARPVEVSYGREGFGATLTLLTTGANAPLLEMQKEKLRDRVNATYGYSAIARIRVTQTHATGFAEGQVSFNHRPGSATPAAPDPAIRKAASDATRQVADQGLRSALEHLGENVLSKSKRLKGHQDGPQKGPAK